MPLYSLIYLHTCEIIWLTFIPALRKLAAILLLGMLFYNWYGYRWLLLWQQEAANLQLEARLDKKDYDESSLIEFKIPIDLPYQNDWTDFEPCDGEITIDGVHYKYVKRKVQDGMLILKCIPNEAKQQIISNRDEFFKLVNGLPQSASTSEKQNTPNSKFEKNTMSDFDVEQYFDMRVINAISLASYSAFYPLLYHYTLSSIPEHPPEA